MSSQDSNQFLNEDKRLKAGIAAAGDLQHRITSLDGLRGIAIALVLIHHSADLPWPPEWSSSVLFKTYWHVAKSLWVGVDVFFVLSGFLITSILLKSRASKNYYSGFYGRRLIRIAPMFLVTLLTVFGVLFWRSEGQWWQFFVLLLSFGNWLIIGGHEVQSLSHFWSLAVEDQFYLTWPFIVKLFNPTKLVKICFGLIISAVLLRLILAWNGTDAYINYKITPTRWDGLAWGALLACLPLCPSVERVIQLYFRRMMWVAGILLLVVFGIKGGLYAFSNFSISLGMPWVELLAFGLVYTALQNRGNRLEKALNWDWIQWLGRYSYSIYLLHVPCLFLAIHLFKNSQGSISGLIFSTAFYLVASLLLARLAWVLVEQPFLNMRHKFKPRFSPAK